MSRSSRRTFVMGGAAAAACMGPLAVAQLAGKSPASRKGAAAPASRSEVAEWERLVGVSFLVAGEAGKVPAKLAAVMRPPVDSKRPADLARFQPFTAYFEVDARLAPAGQQTYRVLHPAKGMIDLFLTRGADKRGKAVLLALFN
ncbi:MAG: hypothetical protein MT490_12445 [Sphingomonas sp.]|uniref:DUF6916 family protein n=1 Tax=Sphingomonas sp. TaxID=28214 RepID=UPI002273A78C|nr:hypothetical protein [Sphingomonas sp.]MCX8476599.1 hypothetical protein [Sphingomonas sp.]